MKAYRGSKGMAPLILNRGTGWKQVISLTTILLYPQGRNSSKHLIGA